jgi:hypothetical protein
MWLSTDPALGEYLPEAPVSDEARERNGKLPGMGGVFNTVNLHLYHYAGNNPVKYTDPDGRSIDNLNDLVYRPWRDSSRVVTGDWQYLRVCPKIITTHKYENMIYSKDGNRNSDTREILVIKNTSG